MNEIEKPRETDKKTMDYRMWLQQEFVSRCRANSAYSVRAFAKYLKTDSSTLSQILSGKRRVSPKIIARFAEILDPDPRVRAAVVEDAEKKQKRKFQSILAKHEHYTALTQDMFDVIADWYHYAIVELTKTKGFSSESRWIASKLGITPAEVQIAVERLLRLKLLEIQDGQYIAREKKITNQGAVPTSAAMKKHQRHIIEKALKAIDETPLERKDLSSMTMAIDEKKLPQAREMIKDFRRTLCGFLEEGEPTTVFNLGIQLYPLTNFPGDNQ